MTRRKKLRERLFVEDCISQRLICETQNHGVDKIHNPPCTVVICAALAKTSSANRFAIDNLPIKRQLQNGVDVVSRIAIESYLIDELPPAAPAEFAVLRASFAEGVPRELTLADGWSVIVQVPTGVARSWLDGDPAEVVASDQLERVPHSSIAAVDEIARAAPRIVVRRGGSLRGALPLSSGMVSLFSVQSALLELLPLRWEIRAGAMRGGVPNSAMIELAWRSRVMASVAGVG